MRTLCGLLFAAACVASQPAMAGTLSVNFDTVPGPDGVLNTGDDGAMPAGTWATWIREELALVGIHFTQGSLGQNSLFDGNPDNVFLTSTSPDAWFDMPVYGISIDSYSMWNATLTAYDGSGNVVAMDSIQNSTYEFKRDTLSITSTAPIYRFTVSPGTEGQILNLDNMILTTSAVPEPTAALMLLAGLGAVGIARRRAKA